MKKACISILLTALLCITGGIVAPSCAGASDTDEVDTVAYTATSDTVAQLLGQVMGNKMLHELLQYRQLEDSAYDIDAFSEGLALVLDRRHDAAYENGVGLGLQMRQDILPLEEAGHTIDRKRIIDSIAARIDADNPLLRDNDMELRTAYVTASDRLKAMSAGTQTRALTDSVERLYARFIADLLNTEIHNFTTTENKPYNEKLLLKGLAAAFGQKQAPEHGYGAYQGLMVSQYIAVVENKGVNVRRQDVLSAMQQVLAGRTVDSISTARMDRRLNTILERVGKEKYEAEDSVMAASDQAVQNIKTGEALVAKMKKNTPQARTTDSGLTYVIHEAGKGDNIAQSDTVVLHYTASHLDGKVINTFGSAKIVPDDATAGLREGLLMLRPGAKASFWVPGALAFRGHGVPQAGVGPMETVVFDVEVLDVLKAAR